jgi:hypothetical protein
MSLDGYHFTADCPMCREKRSVSCSRSRAKFEIRIEVYAIQCDHAWKLIPEQSERLLNNTAVGGFH